MNENKISARITTASTSAIVEQPVLEFSPLAQVSTSIAQRKVLGYTGTNLGTAPGYRAGRGFHFKYRSLHGCCQT